MEQFEARVVWTYGGFAKTSLEGDMEIMRHLELGLVNVEGWQFQLCTPNLADDTAATKLRVLYACALTNRAASQVDRKLRQARTSAL